MVPKKRFKRYIYNVKVVVIGHFVCEKIGESINSAMILELVPKRGKNVHVQIELVK